MKMKYSYFKGNFQCQFSLPKEITPNSKYSKGSKGKFFGLILEDKKELLNAVEISEGEYLEATTCGNDPLSCECLLHNSGNTFSFRQDKETFVEVDLNDGERPERANINQLVLILNKQARNFQYSNGDFYTPKTRQGKLTAPGYIRLYEKIAENKEEKKELVKQEIKSAKSSPVTSIKKKKGCFGAGNTSNVSGRLRNGLFGNPSSGSSGCFGSRGRLFGVPNNGIYGRRNGCFGSPLAGGPGSAVAGGCFGGRGCFGGSTGGCFSLGWLWQLLKWLLFLGLLLYLLSMLRTCDMTPQERIVYIHDTIQTVKIDTVNVIEETTVTSTDKISLPNVQFKTDSDELIEGSMPDIQALAEFMVRNDSVTATIEGHTDDVGEKLHNLELSLARAESVKRELVKMGVDEGRISTKGYGDTKPKATIKGTGKPDTSEEGRLLNRRVEVKLTNMGTTTTTETSETTR